MATWIDIPQNTEDWFQLRCGKIGGSSIGKVMANNGKAFGPPAHELAIKLAIERITCQPVLDNYSNAHMDRGREQEPIARALYEAENFVDVQLGGFYEDGDLGVSPDGLVDSDGLIEIKSVIPAVHFDCLKRKDYDPKYKWQLFLLLKVSGREWIDFVSYCSQFPVGRQIAQYRVYAKDCQAVFLEIDLRLKEFKQLVEDKIKVIEGKA
jgi:hypothetical protein